MELIKYAESVLQATKESRLGAEYDLRFDLIDFIKVKLKESNMTQKALAQKIQMKESQLTRILKAESNITLETVARIYHAFDCKPAIHERHGFYEVISSESTSYTQESICSTPGRIIIAEVN